MITKTDATLKKLAGILGYTPTFGTMLRAIREADGLTQAEFAKVLKISAQKLCDIERGRRYVSPAMAAAFARKLDDSEEYFVLRCLQDELDRNNVMVQLDVRRGSNIKRRATSFYHAKLAT